MLHLSVLQIRFCSPVSVGSSVNQQEPRLGLHVQTSEEPEERIGREIGGEIGRAGSLLCFCLLYTSRCV